MSEVDFISLVHKSTKRDYIARVLERPKEEVAELAKKFAYDYWDGDRTTGYGGYNYDGRWEKVARAMVEHYGIKPGDKILDVGCGKGFLLFDFTKVVPGVEVTGIDISEYAIEHGKEEVRDRMQVCDAAELPFEDNSFDLVISINALHNLYVQDFYKAMKEIERVGKGAKYICVEAYRNEAEKVNLMYWQLTCEMFCTPAEWDWWFKHTGYTGDASFIYFE
ncbi:methyltransferase domain-containing protein [Lentisphaera marina]|uniref:class I SAM-dependent methyltransferase n=1 Tax=Lentisphaera marina TaxID=1111041 RepID=UPI00236605DB|nr:class I SAM-dependent methyltransferase [Lentisphaera marina]MDD7985727.1 methyltransferase domain-containing protein [Lentisphaera marina]